MATRTRRRAARGWLDYWLSSDRPRKPTGRSRSSRSRSSGSGGPGSLAWWLGNVGSKPAPAYGRITPPPKIRNSKAACPLCHKAAGCKCKMIKGEPIKRPRRRPGSRPYAYPPDFRAQGAIWCGNCRHRINTATGHCTNTRCPR
jgi:hypothetical protein